MADERTLLFVYGTLKTGECRNVVLTQMGCKRIDANTGLKGFALYDLGPFPCITEDPGVKGPKPNYQVWGEVWDIPAELLRELDWIEGVGSGLYQRKEIETEGGYNCWVYYMTEIPRRGGFLSSGRWSSGRSLD